MRASQNTVRLAGVLGLAVAGAAATLFIVAAGLQGHAGVPRFGGASWVFLLAWIISMPVLAPWLKRLRS
jgi:hypothetical protein